MVVVKYLLISRLRIADSTLSQSSKRVKLSDSSDASANILNWRHFSVSHQRSQFLARCPWLPDLAATCNIVCTRALRKREVRPKGLAKLSNL